MTGKRYGTRTLCLLVGILALYVFIYELLLPKSGMVTEFYHQEPDTVDVLVLGSSNSYSNINPAILWEEKGIASYLLCGSGQPIWNSYYYLEEAYKTQKPKVVVLDIFSMPICQNGYDELSNVPGNTLSLKWSETKLNAVMDSVPEKQRLQLILGLPVFHNRWTEILTSGFRVDMRNGAMKKGFYPLFFLGGQGAEQYPNAYEEPPAKNVEYLDRIVELTKKKGSKLLLIKTPYCLGEYQNGVFNWVEEYCIKQGIPYINYNKMTAEIDFHYETDMCDIVHLNNLGVKKITRHLAGVLSEEFNVPDRKADEKYNSWESYWALWKQTSFMAPRGKEEEQYISSKKNFAYYDLGNLQLYQAEVSLGKDRYYKISATRNADMKGLESARVDIFAEGYDKAEMEMMIDLNDDYPFVILHTDEQCPEKVWIRVMGAFDENAFDELIVSEWIPD